MFDRRTVGDLWRAISVLQRRRDLEAAHGAHDGHRGRDDAVANQSACRKIHRLVTHQRQQPGRDALTVIPGPTLQRPSSAQHCMHVKNCDAHVPAMTMNSSACCAQALLWMKSSTLSLTVRTCPGSRFLRRYIAIWSILTVSTRPPRNTDSCHSDALQHGLTRPPCQGTAANGGPHLLVEYFLRVRSLAWAGPNGLIRAKRQISEYTANVPPVVCTSQHMLAPWQP